MEKPKKNNRNSGVIIIPTYNEKENIEKLIKEIFRLNTEISILVIDDNSPDGTGKIVDALTKKIPKLKVVHGEEKKGLGAAYIKALKHVLKERPEKLITMDADFSHNPKDISRFLEESDKFDVVVGSRYILGGKTNRWELWRKILSWGGIKITKFFLGLKIKDCTSGFRCYRIEFLETLELDKISSQGYAFQVEMLFEAQRRGFSIGEIPITFSGRKEGESKVDFREIVAFTKSILKLAFIGKFAPVKKRKENISPDYYEEGMKKNIIQHYYHQIRFKGMIDFIGDFRGKILDIGSNGGNFINEISKALPGAEIKAIDTAERAVNYAQKKYPHISFQIGDGHNLKFEKESFDMITILEVLEHVENPTKVIEESWRCLKKDGLLAVLVPSENLIFKIIWFFWERGKGKGWVHLHKFRGDSLDHLLESAGFKTEKRKLLNFSMLLAIKARKVSQPSNSKNA